MALISKIPSRSIFFAIAICVPFAAFAQKTTPANSSALRPPAAAKPQVGRKADLVRALGLSPEQLGAIRRLRVDRKPIEQEARRRFQAASRELNRSIYSDASTDENFAACLREFQAAQAELARIKFSNELAVRRLLTPEQLSRFRELRREFAENAEDSPNQGQEQRVMRRLRRNALDPPMN